MRDEYDMKDLKEIENPYKGKFKSSGIHLSPEVINYFKKLSKENNVPFQKLIDLYLQECVKEGRKIDLDSVG